MRVSFAVAILLALTFAGCSDKKGGTDDDHDHETYDCPDGTVLDLEDIAGHDNASFNPADHCPDGGNGNGNGNNTSTPNVPPVLVLKVLDAPGGNETNVSIIDVPSGRTTLTFVADGSSDPDGEIAGIAVTVTDSNRTQTKSLYVGGQFMPATFTFDRAGIANVTAAMVDNRAGFSIIQQQVFINSREVKTTNNMAAAHPAHSAATCIGPVQDETGENNPVDASMYAHPTFSVAPNASFVEVTRTALATPGSIEYAICTPEGVAISETATGAGPLFSNNADPLPASSEYEVSIVSRAPQSQPTMQIIVHYEPRPAAPAA